MQHNETRTYNVISVQMLTNIILKNIYKELCISYFVNFQNYDDKEGRITKNSTREKYRTVSIVVITYRL